MGGAWAVRTHATAGHWYVTDVHMHMVMVTASRAPQDIAGVVDWVAAKVAAVPAGAERAEVCAFLAPLVDTLVANGRGQLRQLDPHRIPSLIKVCARACVCVVACVCMRACVRVFLGGGSRVEVGAEGGRSRDGQGQGLGRSQDGGRQLRRQIGWGGCLGARSAACHAGGPAAGRTGCASAFANALPPPRPDCTHQPTLPDHQGSIPAPGPWTLDPGTSAATSPLPCPARLSVEPHLAYPKP